MIDYLERRPDNQIAIHRGVCLELLDKPLRHLLNRWLEAELTTYDARIKTTAKRFNVQRNVPIWIDATTMYLPLRGVRAIDALLVNWRAIVASTPLKNGQLRLCFASGNALVVSERIAYRRLEAIAKRIFEEMTRSSMEKENAYMLRNPKRNNGNLNVDLV
jgi:hypothetical protein